VPGDEAQPAVRHPAQDRIQQAGGRALPLHQLLGTRSAPPSQSGASSRYLRYLLGRTEVLTSHRASVVNVAVNENPAERCPSLLCQTPTEQRKHRISVPLHTGSND
jgi:hypothetical protein